MQSDTTTVMVGIVDQGLVGPSHFKGYQTHPSAEVVAVCDLARERAESFAKAHNIPHVYTSYEDMLANADINTVDIATPTFLHVSMPGKPQKQANTFTVRNHFVEELRKANLPCRPYKGRVSSSSWVKPIHSTPHT